MKNFLPALLKDGYKVGHPFQYPKNTNMVYSNITARGSRVPGVNKVVAFGFQYFVMEYLIRQFNENFFAQPKAAVLAAYKRRIDNYLGPGVDTKHIADLHDLGYLPLQVKAVPEGTLVPLRVPLLTIRNTHENFGWLTNMVETLMSNVTWQGITSATTAHEYWKEFDKYATLTGADKAFVSWQGHDFSMRGMSGMEAACLSGAAHLLSFTGTDTIPAIDFLEEYYGADCTKELIGGSVPATEHSVMCMGKQDGELNTIRRLITEIYPKGIVSIVCDTWDFWKVLTEYLPALKNEIMARDGKVVIRPDSGNPVDIICGIQQGDIRPEFRGAIQLLWDTFGGTTTSEEYKQLDAHIGLIYGDSITRERQTAILSRLALQGFASSNVVLGIGSYTYQMTTRDTFGQAIKATYGEVDHVGQNISKDPKTDDGLKKSASGLLKVYYHGNEIAVKENCSWQEEGEGILHPIFIDGQQYNFQTLSRVRARLLMQD